MAKEIPGKEVGNYLLNFRLKPRRPQTPCVQQAPLPCTELAELTKHSQAAFSRNHPQHKNKYYMKFNRKACKEKPNRNLQEPPFVSLDYTIYNWICLFPLPILFNPGDVSLCPHSLCFQKLFSKLNELHISRSTTNMHNLFGGQNLTKNLIKYLAFSVETGTISMNSHMSWVPWGLKTSVPVAASFHFLSALNLRNTWQPTSICKNYVTLTNFKNP